MKNSTIQNVSFGMNIPTKNVIELASNACIRQGQFDDNVKVIHQLISYKTDLYDRGGIGCAVTFEAVSRVINKQFPQLKPIIDDIKSILKFANEDEKLYKKNLNKIMKKAEKTFGKELDVSTAEVENAVGISDSPLSAAAYGLL